MGQRPMIWRGRSGGAGRSGARSRSCTVTMTPVDSCTESGGGVMATPQDAALTRFSAHLRGLELPLPIEGAEQARAEVSSALDQIRSEEHTSELQSRGHLVCRLLLEKK